MEYAWSNLTGKLAMKGDTTYPIMLTSYPLTAIILHNTSLKISTFLMPKASVLS
jgi:hypothetical protein